jgi:hypothetical protein
MPHDHRFEPYLVATRKGLPPVCAPVEMLCLQKTATGMYRLYTTEAFTLAEEPWDLDPVDFLSAYDVSVTHYLTESFWRLVVTEDDLDEIIWENLL